MLSKIISDVDAFVWGPVMLVLLVGTGILLTIRCNFLTWRNLPWAIIKTLSKESRTKNRDRIIQLAEMFPQRSRIKSSFFFGSCFTPPSSPITYFAGAYPSQIYPCIFNFLYMYRFCSDTARLFIFLKHSSRFCLPKT